MPDRFTRLASIGDLASAQVVAARLRSEGVEVRLHGEGVGPYAMTVGQLAVVDLWVMESRLDDAQRILLELEVDDAMRGPSPASPLELNALRRRLLSLVIAVALLWAVVWTAMSVW